MKKFFTSLQSLGTKLVVCGSILVFTTTFSFAQCKGFVKKQIPRLAPYIFNGQVNSSVLLSGDHTKTTLTFYAGQTYRVMVAAQTELENTYFLVKDANNQQLFSSKDQGKLDYWDFIVESTQQLTIEVVVPDKEAANGLVPSGCVSVLIGFKQ